MKKTAKHIIKYIKSSNFFTIGVNGVYGGISSSGKININFYVESVPLPDNTILDIDIENGSVLNDTTSLSHSANSVRELSSGINVDLDTAKSISMWLQAKIKELEEIHKGQINNP